MNINKEKVFLVIPTIRDLVFLKSWKNEFMDCNLIAVEDGGKKDVKIPNNHFKSITHFGWNDIDRDLGKDNWIISRRNAGIRSYGFLKAYQMGADIIITLDDDCYPDDVDFVYKHLRNLRLKMPGAWFTTYPNPKWMYTRGFPYRIRKMFPVGLSHGLWSGALDLDAKTEIRLQKLLNEKRYPPTIQFMPFGYYYPMCSMNLAFKREIAPLMFFPMMGQNPDGGSWGYDRYDDIWAGLFSKKIMDHLKIGVVSGSPFINHRKASLVKHNHSKEINGMKINEMLWESVNDVELTATTPKLCYLELAGKIKFPKTRYFKKLREAMIVWANLF
jgi:hypothetical protein